MYIDTPGAFGLQKGMSHTLPPAIRIQVGPANAFSHSGSYQRLAEFFTEAELSQALWIGGRRALAAAGPFLPKVFHEASERVGIVSGHCRRSLVSQWAAKVGKGPVVGLGGGSALDTAKAVAALADRPFVALPTIAATCAAWTPLSVWYDEEGRALNFEIFRQAAFLVLIEPRILAAAPVQYLQAGIGDTLAKWYEARVLTHAVEPLPLAARLGLDISQVVRDLLLEKGEAALEANRAGQPDATFVDVVDAVVAAGGSVGGFGERFTRVAAAHSVHNGLTALHEMESVLHGSKVAFGILVQLWLEGRIDEWRALRDSYAALGLPSSWAALGLDPADPRIDAVITKTLLPHESIHALPFRVTPETLKEALLA